MNKDLHKIIFSRKRNAYVVVSETASSVSGSSRGSSASSFTSAHAGLLLTTGLSLTFALMASAFAAPALPQGGNVSKGAAVISQSGNVMTVNQSTDKAVVNWQSFSIGAGAAVNIVQPSASSTHLSRVTGNDPSVIQGQLNSNGQVVLVNPNGIVVGKDGSVSASSFTASTLNITDDDFMAGKYQYARKGANGEVVNQGKIETKAGGYVALLGAKVTNEGTITSQQGAVYLGAGDAVAVPVTGSGRIKFEVSPAAINTAVTNSKDAVIVAEGGQVYMRAASLNDLAVASVQQSGLVDVSGGQGGNVTVLADKGKIKVDGTIKANSTVAAKGGNIVMGHDVETGVLAAQGNYSGAKLEAAKGFVETSGSWIATNETSVKAGEWLLDPVNIEIDNVANNVPFNPICCNYTFVAGVPTSFISATTVSTALNIGTHVTISTGVYGPSDLRPLTDPQGNIHIKAEIVKSGIKDATLTLIANNSITVGARIGKKANETHDGKLNIEMTAHGLAPNSFNSRGIALNNVLDANGGKVTLTGTSYNLSNTNVGEANLNTGVNFGHNSGVYAESYTISGTSIHPSSTNNVNLSGVSFEGKGVVLSSTGSSRLTGWSSSNGNFAPGIYFADKSNTTIDAQNGSVLFAGEHANIDRSGVRIGKAIEGGTNKLTLTTKGNVTISSQTTTGTTTGLLRGQMSYRNGNISVESGTLSLTGEKVDFFDFTANLTAKNGTTVNLFAEKDVTLSKAWSGGNFNTNGSAATFNITSSSGVIEINRYINAGLGTVNLEAPSIILRDTSANETVASDKSINARLTNITTNSLAVSAKHTVITAGTGNTLEIKTRDAEKEIHIGAADSSGGLGLSQQELNNFTTSNLVIGDTAKSGNVEVLSPTTTLNTIGALTLRTKGSISINNSLTVGATPSSLKNLTLQASGVNISVSQSAALKAAGLSLIGDKATYMLINTGNVFSKLTGVVKSADVFSNTAFAIDTIGSSSGLQATGTIKLVSNSNITVNQRVETTDTSSSAIFINAGESANAGNLGGGNIVVNASGTSGAIEAGAGARITLMTGSISGSTGLGVTDGNNRYGSDKSTPNYTKPLGAGKYAIYREQPTVTVKFKDSTKVYDGETNIGNSDYVITPAPVKPNETTVLSDFVYTVTPQSAKDVGSYDISASSAKSDLGYKVDFDATPGKLTITERVLTASVFANSKTYDGNTTATGTINLGGLVSGESLATNVASLTFDNKNAGTNKLVTATGITLADSGDFKASNYKLAAPTATGFATIDKKTLALDVSGASILDKSYNANTSATFNVRPTLVGVVTGDAVDFSAAANFSDPNAGKNKLVTLSNVALAGGDASNYNLTTPATLTGNINKARISVTINNATINAGGTLPLTYTVNGLVNGQTATSAGISLLNLRADGYSASNVGPGTYNILADGLNALNYELADADSIIPGVLSVLAATNTTDSTRGTPEFTGQRVVPTDSSNASSAIVIGGAPQGGEFALASAEECATESCVCETSDFDRDVELCYEEDVRSSKSGVRRSPVSL